MELPSSSLGQLVAPPQAARELVVLQLVVLALFSGAELEPLRTSVPQSSRQRFFLLPLSLWPFFRPLSFLTLSFLQSPFPPAISPQKPVPPAALKPPLERHSPFWAIRIWVIRTSLLVRSSRRLPRRMRPETNSLQQKEWFVLWQLVWLLPQALWLRVSTRVSLLQVSLTPLKLEAKWLLRWRP